MQLDQPAASPSHVGLCSLAGAGSPRRESPEEGPGPRRPQRGSDVQGAPGPPPSPCLEAPGCTPPSSGSQLPPRGPRPLHDSTEGHSRPRSCGEDWHGGAGGAGGMEPAACGRAEDGRRPPGATSPPRAPASPGRESPALGHPHLTSRRRVRGPAARSPCAAAVLGGRRRGEHRDG